jgi:hypothetical protein
MLARMPQGSHSCPKAARSSIKSEMPISFIAKLRAIKKDRRVA